MLPAPHADSRRTPPQRVFILGAGGHGRVVLDILKQASEHEVVGFLDSCPDLHGEHMDGVQVLGSADMLSALRTEGIGGAIVAIGDNGTRRAFMDRVDRSGLALINAVHPSSNIASNVSLGRGLVIAAGALVCAHCQIGDGVILNTGCIVDHETMIGTCCHICPGAKLAGRVTVESGALVGLGATIVQRVRIGHDARVGAGAVVLHSVPPMTTVVGMPARPIKTLNDPDSRDAWTSLQTASIADKGSGSTTLRPYSDRC